MADNDHDRHAAGFDRKAHGAANLLLWFSVAAGVVALAVALASTALPPDNAVAQKTNGAEDTPYRLASAKGSDLASSMLDADSGIAPAAKVQTVDTLVPQMGGTQNPAASSVIQKPGPVHGPPEKKMSIAEAAIARFLSINGDADDVAAVKAALRDVRSRRWSDALSRTASIKSQGAPKLVQWYAYRSFGSGVPAETIEDFRLANPEWPEQDVLRQRAEQALFLVNAQASTVHDFFKTKPPQFPSGQAAVASAELADGKTGAARKRIAEVWRNGKFGSTIEARILTRFNPLLTEQDHIWRLNIFFLNDDRYGRQGRLANIRRLIKLLGPDEAAKAKARLLVWRSYGRRGQRRRIAAAIKAFAAIERKKAAERIALPARKPSEPPSSSVADDDTAPVVEADTAAIKETSVIAKPDVSRMEAGKPDWPLAYHHIQMLRRQGKNGEAWRKLIDTPTATNLIVNPDGWWVERRTNAYNALYKNSPRTAYRLVARNGDLGTNARNEALFMAGWIALRKLGDPDAARRHFEDFTQSADGPRTRSQAHYWLARTMTALNDNAAARSNFERAAKEFNTFYGQLARQALEPDLQRLNIPEPRKLTDDAIAAFVSRDVIQALRFAHLAGHRDATRRLLRALRKSQTDPDTLHLLAEFAKTTSDTQMGVRIGKTALFHGVPLGKYAYPIHAFPNFKPLRPPPEYAMLYGLARQESEFNTLITSIAGARGVLQVMHVTARDVCRIYKLRCGSRATLKRRLSTDPGYNAKLAAAYISDRQEEFGGSYILTFAGYNAGPGRARYWIRKNGDPRDANVDPIDWIESIHLKETRNYVKKVMANLQIYRARLGKPETALQITTDINRGSR